MQIGSMTAFLSYVMQILFAVLMAVMSVALMPARRRPPSASTRCSHGAADPRTPRPPARVAAEAGVVEFRNVEFGYPSAEEPVLRGITLRFKPGRTTAIVGSTGSGKTTLVNLIPRLYDVTGGAVLVDGVDVRERDRQELWSRLGLVPQRAFLFSGTVADNLRYGKESATDDELWHALDVAQARDVVEELSGGLDARDRAGRREPLRRPAAAPGDRPRAGPAAGGLHVRRQLLRARLRHRRPTARGPASRHRGRDRDRRRAARSAPILGADQIVVLDEGTVVGVGTHEELLGELRDVPEIVASQLAAAEAA